MEVKTKKLTRRDISNPFWRYSNAELLKMAGVKKFVNPIVECFPNGKIKVIESKK